MHRDQLPYRELYHRILEYRGAHLYAEILRPWLDAETGERAWLEDFAIRIGRPIPEASVEDRWRLYALSRISDLLILSFAPRGAGRKDTWKTATVTVGEYVEFMESLGLSRVRCEDFHPFFHEIAVVDQTEDPSAPIRLGAGLWPTFCLGPMLFARGGCRVSGGRDHIVKEIAENSTLYWAYARRHRSASDPSHGWGSNSQWRTAFRRDYYLLGAFHYNVDARPEARPYELDEDLTADEKLELLLHRCFIRCPKPHDDRFPYDCRHTEAE